MRDSHPDYVTVSIARRVKQGCEQAYETWVKNISATAAAFPGHLGVNVLRPGAGADNEYVIIYRYDNYEHCKAWEESEERQQWVDQLGDMVEGEPRVKKVTGLESWFDLPDIPAEKKPIRYRMFITLAVVVYCMITFLSLALAPFLQGLPGYLKSAIVIVIQVWLMTYLIMPRVTRLLKNWLYGSPPS